ncbi:glycoside hydrolase family 97 N-terminal domain-containing protein [Bacteroides ovatus]|nr:glycoside hydrolase family 97 N-terminal domain-containing protein [Bacteroides ovatus]
MHSNSSQNYTVSSPDGKTKVTVTAGKQLSWSINYNGERILNPSLMQMEVEGQTEQIGSKSQSNKLKHLK